MSFSLSGLFGLSGIVLFDIGVFSSYFRGDLSSVMGVFPPVSMVNEESRPSPFTVGETFPIDEFPLLPIFRASERSVLPKSGDSYP